MKRRKFILSLVGTAAAGFTAWKLGGLNKTGGAFLSPDDLAGSLDLAELAKVTRSTRALGTNVNLTVFHRDAGAAERAIAESFRELDRVEDLMSLYRPDSQLSRLNRSGHLDDPDPALVDVLQASRNLSERTSGAFDITVQPLWQLYDDSARAGQSLDPTALETALASVDWRRVRIAGDRIEIEGRGTRITLNGIAQGYASDAVKRVLQSHGIQNALIDTGEIEALGQTASNRDWTIGIKHPRKTGDFIGLAGLHDRALATSGDYESRFSDDFRDHHLLDPRTGHSPSELSSVSIAAPTGLQADALSTAVFILGLKDGRRLVESTPQTDALFVTKQGRVEQTSGFPLVS